MQLAFAAAGAPGGAGAAGVGLHIVGAGAVVAAAAAFVSGVALGVGAPTAGEGAGPAGATEDGADGGAPEGAEACAELEGDARCAIEANHATPSTAPPRAKAPPNTSAATTAAEGRAGATAAPERATGCPVVAAPGGR